VLLLKHVIKEDVPLYAYGIVGAYVPVQSSQWVLASRFQQNITSGKLTVHPLGGLSPEGSKTEGVGAEPGNN